jgi:hypothetical protein
VASANARLELLLAVDQVVAKHFDTADRQPVHAVPVHKPVSFVRLGLRNPFQTEARAFAAGLRSRGTWGRNLPEGSGTPAL